MEKANRFLTGWKSWLFLILVVATAAPEQLVAADKKNPVPRSERFDFQERADPFKPFLEGDVRKKKAQETLKAIPLSPLTQDSVHTFRLTGIVGVDESRVAVVEDGKGRFFLLFPGSRIGTRGGRVVSIQRDHVVIEERIKTSGREKREEIKMRFHLEGHGEKP